MVQIALLKLEKIFKTVLKEINFKICCSSAPDVFSKSSTFYNPASLYWEINKLWLAFFSPFLPFDNYLFMCLHYSILIYSKGARKYIYILFYRSISQLKPWGNEKRTISTLLTNDIENIKEIWFWSYFLNTVHPRLIMDVGGSRKI